MESPTVSPVNNHQSVITATTVKPIYNYSGTGRLELVQDNAERYVITFVPVTINRMPFGIYKEKLVWNPITFLWDHDSYSEGTYRSTYVGAMKNLQFRVSGIIGDDGEGSNKIVAL